MFGMDYHCSKQVCHITYYVADISKIGLLKFLRYETCHGNDVGARNVLVQTAEILKELLAQQTSATLLLNNTVELGEKLYPSTALEGRETIRLQLQELQQALEHLYDCVCSAERELQAKLSR